MFKEKGSFMKMLNDGEQVFAPSVWDCFSAKAAELCGYRAMLLSGAAVSKGLTGMPDSALRRREVGNRWHVGEANAKTLWKRLNMLKITKAMLEERRDAGE